MIGDAFDEWEVISNQGETLAAALNGIPVVSLAVNAVGASGWVAYANEIANSIRENYDADYSVAYENDLACALFCAAGSNCQLSLQQMIDVVGARITANINLGSILELVTSIIDLNITGLNVADIYMFFLLNALKLANWLLPSIFGIERFFAVIALIEEENNDWITLCADCVWVHTFPTDTAFTAFTLLTFQGAVTTIANNKIVGATDNVNFAVIVNFKKTVTASLTKIEFDIEFDAPAAGQQFILYKNGVSVQSITLDGSSPKTLTYTAASSGANEWEVLSGVFGTTAAGRYVRVTASRWYGTGTNPF